MVTAPNELRRLFRYLKRGVFPPSSIEDLTFGRNDELNGIESKLTAADSGVSQHAFIEGVYGRGKSHFLKAVESISLRRGFAVSWITLDGYSHACNHPSRYLHTILENLRIPESSAKGLVSILRSWLRTEKKAVINQWAKSTGAEWLSHPIRIFSAIGDNGQLSNPWWNGIVEGRDFQHRSGRTWYPAVSARLASTASLCKAVGLRGIVYLLDEVETIATLLTTIRQRLLSYEFLNLLIDGRRHPNCVFIFAATPDFGLRRCFQIDEKIKKGYDSRS